MIILIQRDIEYLQYPQIQGLYTGATWQDIIPQIDSNITYQEWLTEYGDNQTPLTTRALKYLEDMTSPNNEILAFGDLAIKDNHDTVDLMGYRYGKWEVLSTRSSGRYRFSEQGKAVKEILQDKQIFPTLPSLPPLRIKADISTEVGIPRTFRIG